MANVRKNLPVAQPKNKQVPASKPAGAKLPVRKAEQPSRLAKFDTKLSKISIRKHNPKQEYSVKIVSGRSPVQIVGYLLKIEGDVFTVSHTKPRSSKETVSLFRSSDVIQYTGAVGERCELTVMQSEVFREIKRAHIENKQGATVITDLTTHDVTVFNVSNTDGFTLLTSLVE